MSLSGFIWGMLIVASGALITWKTEYMLEIMGRNWWAEKTFGPGGSRLFYKLWGIAVILLGMIIAFDLFGYFFGNFLLRIFPTG